MSVEVFPTFHCQDDALEYAQPLLRPLFHWDKSLVRVDLTLLNTSAEAVS